MASKSPDRADLIEPVCSELGRGVPCDLTWYDEPYLSDSLGGRLLMCRWDAHAVTGYRLRKPGRRSRPTKKRCWWAITTPGPWASRSARTGGCSSRRST